MALLFACACLLWNPVAWADPVHVTTEPSIDLVGATEYQIDKRPAEAWEDLDEAAWRPLPPSASVGVPRAPVWLRVQVDLPAPNRRLVHVNDLGVQGGSLIHLPEGGAPRIRTYAVGRPLAERDIVDPTLVFPVDLPAGPSTLLVRVETAEALLARTRLVSEPAFAWERQTVWMAWAAYFGLIGGLALYNLFLGATLRDRAYLLYVVMVILTHGLLQLKSGGLLFHLLPTWPVGELAPIGDVFVALGAIGAAAFAWDFLKVPSLAPITRWLYLPVLFLAVSVPLGDRILPPLSFIATMALLGTAPIALVGSAIESWWRGHGPARWFLLAWSVLLIGVVWTLLRALGVLPLIGFQGVELLVGSAAEATLLSIALADRIRTLRREERRARFDGEIARREAAEARLGAERQRIEFLSTMSHELRTPMHQVLGLASLLRADEHDPTRQEELQLLMQSGESLAQLIEDMLLYTELEGRRATQMRPCHLPTWLERACAPHAEHAKRRGLSFTVSRRGSEVANIDERLLDRVLAHLVDNAIKFTQHGFVDVQLSLDPTGEGGQACLSLAVTDSGPGIAPDRLEEVFALFRRGDHSLSRRVGGIGMGLSMCRIIAEALAGTLSVTDLDGEGTRVVLEIPVEVSELEVTGGARRGDGAP